MSSHYEALPQEPPRYTDFAESPAENPLANNGAKKTDTPVFECSKSIRMAFLRKVYMILSAQLVVTAVAGTIFGYTPVLFNWLQMNPWFLLVSFIGMMVTMFFLLAKPYSYPRNYILLFTFTLLEGITLGSVISFFSSQILLEAVFITMGTFIALTAFTFQSKYDFSRWGGVLYASLWILVLLPLLYFIFPGTRMMDLGFAGFGTLIFCGYIMYDTYNILHNYSPEDFIMSSLMLYMDLINLFIRILSILNILQNNDE
ncbi:eukaryotic protein [Schizosaccharomyces japonicus yFS275]|uniref:Eukaryotic protein n=1 Tax=Schizosaccharomyces japonicus (strain yFS275 / FY16936) TaxID=402676 RepID=B6K6X1_SCHJY|nr:eukaryotic protein [Schizosaccharomyces japonicus yFS275]EEB09275.1 eukaryotic protein [Schizosaccharomyces japonicus yFS275]